jgi:adenosylhomocysteinase
MNAFETVRSRYPEARIPFLRKMLDRVRVEKPYAGLKVLHNAPLTIESVLKMEPLIAGGAKLSVASFKGLPPNAEALEILRAAHVPVLSDHVFDGEYDFHLDCCGQLIGARPPRIGAVELTQTGSEIYRRAQARYPVMSVDDSRIKILETLYATGDGFVRAMRQLRGNEICGKHYVLFGFGKVGQGIVRALSGVSAAVTVVDADIPGSSSRRPESIRFIDAREMSAIKQVVADAYCIVTATGVRGLMSDHFAFSKADFSQATLLANMGGDDEWGDNFSESDVLFEKMALNFSLEEPTDIIYLDPIFYAHNLGIELILSGRLHPGYNRMPDDVSAQILNDWQALHHRLSDGETSLSPAVE